MESSIHKTFKRSNSIFNNFAINFPFQSTSYMTLSPVPKTSDFQSQTSKMAPVLCGDKILVYFSSSILWNLISHLWNLHSFLTGIFCIKLSLSWWFLTAIIIYLSKESSNRSMWNSWGTFYPSIFQYLIIC